MFGWRRRARRAAEATHTRRADEVYGRAQAFADLIDRRLSEIAPLMEQAKRNREPLPPIYIEDDHA